MTDSMTSPRAQDIESVGSRISWSAIFAGALIAMGMYFLFASLGAAVGLSISERAHPVTLKTGAIAWAFLTTIVALFVGGMVTSLFSVGENKVEAVMSGIIMWALLVSALLLLGAAGIRAGFNAMQGIAHAAQNASNHNWESDARAAGVPAEQIEDWQRKHGGNDTPTVQVPQNAQASSEAATRLGWYAFAGTWLSMIAAAAGGLAGAGPTFRVVAVHRVLTSTQAPVTTG